MHLKAPDGRNSCYEHQYWGTQAHRDAAMHAMRPLSHRSVALSRVEESEILLADDELSRLAHHLAVVGENSTKATALYQTALATPGGISGSTGCTLPRPTYFVVMWSTAGSAIPPHMFVLVAFARSHR